MAGEARFTSDELNASGQQSLEARFYVYQQNSFEPLVMQHQPFAAHEDGAPTATDEAVRFGQLYNYQNDLNGAPVRLRDRDGDVVWEARYSVTGQAADEGARWLDQSLRLQGQYLDGETGLHYNCYRYYDPEQASFISSDPVALKGGINVYQYAPNPISWIDPLGLTSSCLTSRAARREAMRQAGIPVSQQPISQSRNASGREYRYEVPDTGGGSIHATVQQQTMDVSHPDDFHWEAGKVKINLTDGKTRLNDYGRPKIANPKGKAYYGNHRRRSAV
jgi:RHS repeat-associated protein